VCVYNTAAVVHGLQPSLLHNSTLVPDALAVVMSVFGVTLIAMPSTCTSGRAAGPSADVGAWHMCASLPVLLARVCAHLHVGQSCRLLPRHVWMLTGQTLLVSILGCVRFRDSPCMAPQEDFADQHSQLCQVRAEPLHVPRAATRRNQDGDSASASPGCCSALGVYF
jgi:hypothetical protein